VLCAPHSHPKTLCSRPSVQVTGMTISALRSRERRLESCYAPAIRSAPRWCPILGAKRERPAARMWGQMRSDAVSLTAHSALTSAYINNQSVVRTFARFGTKRPLVLPDLAAGSVERHRCLTPLAHPPPGRCRSLVPHTRHAGRCCAEPLTSCPDSPARSRRLKAARRAATDGVEVIAAAGMAHDCRGGFGDRPVMAC
jgi:hypothetical protein